MTTQSEKLKLSAMSQASPIEDGLVERLRKYDWHIHKPGGSERTDLPFRAADRIEAQSQSIRVMREALEDAMDLLTHFRREAPLETQPQAGVFEALRDKARSALGASGE